MGFRNTIKKLGFSLYDSHRVVLLDYPVSPDPCYSEKPHKNLFSLIDGYRDDYHQLLTKTLACKNQLATIQEEKEIPNDIDPGWNNGYFPGLDIIMLYSMLVEYRPAVYIEIGSGTSTKVANKARKENALDLQIVSIDPAPRKKIDRIADKIYPVSVSQADLSLFESLKENDIVFLDGTHSLYPGSDVMWFFLEILPLLKKGVIIQVHDIYLPFDYPDFMLRRYYNEQYLLGALLLNNPGKFRILSPNYFIYSDQSLLGILDPVWQLQPLQNVEKHGGSFWLQVRS